MGNGMKRLMVAGLMAAFVATSGMTAFATSGSFTVTIVGETVYATPPQNSERQNSVPPASNPAPSTTPADTSLYPQQVLELVNIEREKAGLSPLELDSALTQAAQIRAVELETLYSHTRPDESNWSSVFDENALALRPVAENIAFGQRDSKAVMNAWMNSPGHRKNILKEKAEYIGIAVHVKENGNLCWVQLFAKD